MRRIFAALLAVLALSICGQSAFAQTIATINSAAPTSVTSGSGDTAITLTMRQSGTTRYNVCFYSGATSAPITPSAYNFQNASAVTYTLTVPGARFQTGGGSFANSVYLAPTSSAQCTATNQGVSNIFSYSTTAVSYSVSSASPSSTPIGSGSTTITFSGTFPTFPSNGTGLGLCFYNGTSNAPLLPTSQSGSTSATFSVPYTDFFTAGSAKVYLASDTSTCTGVSPGYSSTLSYTVAQSIQGSFPSPLPAGGGNTQVTLYGTFSGTNANICFYTGSASSLIAASTVNSSEVVFTVPAASLALPPSSFSSGTYNAKIYFGPAGAGCNGTSAGISNTLTAPISYPQVTSASLATIPQVNPALAAYTPLPSRIDLSGSGFSSSVSTTFTPNAGSAVTVAPSAVIGGSSAVVALPSFSSSATSTSANVCNSSGNFQYCGTTPVTVTNYPLATSTTQIVSSPASPNPGSPVTLSATITPGSGSTTAGGTFVPGPATGIVTFSDTGTSLGTATLKPNALSFAPASTQQIAIYAGTDSLPPRTGELRRSQPVSAAIRPNETPSPDVSSQFTSLIADFNQDGINDTLLIQTVTGIMHLFLGGSPLGTLQTETTIYPGNYYSCSSLSGVTAADFNGDGFPDLAYLCGDSGGYSNIQVLLNQGDGSFASSPANVAYVTANQLAAADVNKDGKMDLVATGNTGTLCCTGQTFGIQVFTGDGTGNFTSGTLTTTADIPGTQVVLKDLNNDGAPDLTFLHYDATNQRTEVSIWQNNGSGGFTKLAPLPICNCQVTNTKLFVTPLNTASLYPDIVVDYSEGSNILAFVNKKTATIAFNTIAPALYSNLTDVVLGDFNGDGFTDFAQYNGTGIVFELGNGTGTFALNTAAFAPYTVGTGAANLTSLATAPDLNGDGYADLLVINPTATSNPTTSTITSLVTTGTATASLPTTLNTAGSRTITTAYTGNRNVLGSNGSQPVAVGRSTPNITWNPPATTTTTTPVSTFLNATAVDPATGASVPGSFAYTYTPPSGTYLSAGTQTITTAFTPTNTGIYNTASTTRNITVNKVTPTITTTINPGNHTYTPNLATTYSVIVTGANIVPTGNVQANNNGSPVGSLAGLSQSGTNQSSTQILFSSLPAGTFGFTGTYQGDAVYNAVTSAITNYTVSKSTPTVTYTPTPTSIAYGTGLVPNQLNATAVDPNTGASVPGTVTYSTPSISNLQTGSLLPVGANVVTASFVPTDATDYNTSTKTGTITVTKTTPSITYTPTPTSITYGTGLVANQLNATAVDPASGAAVPGTFTYSTPGFTSLQTGSILPAGSNVITASFVPTDTTNYGSASKTATVTVATATTTTTVSVSPTNIAPGQSVRISVTVTPNPAGTAVTGLVNFTDDNGPGTQVTLSNGTGSVNYTPANSGTHNLSAAYAGTVNYSPSSSTTPATFTVTKITPTVTYTPTPTSIVYGTALIASQLNATAVDPSTGATVPGTFSYSSGTLTNIQPGSMLPTGSNTVTAAFTPSSATYANASKSAVITVTPVSTTTILAVTPTSISVGQSSRLQATITANSGIYGVSQGTVTFSDDNGTIPNATGQLIGGITVVDYSPTNVGTHRITAAYSGSANFSASSTATPISLLVTQKTPRLTYSPTPASISYGTALIAGQLNATALDAATGAAVPGVFDYSTPSIPGVGVGTILPAGANVVTARFTPSDATNYATATQPATITVTQFTPNIVWATPASIPYGTALSATQLNAVANDVNGTAIPGTYSYSPAAGTIPSVGSTSDTVTFTPTNTTNFATATATRTITVTAGTTTTSINLNPATIVLGQSTTIGISVTPTLGSNMIFGQVTVTDDRGTITPAQVSLAYGVASITYTPTTVGIHIINVAYPGNSTYAASSNSAPLTVTQGTPVITFAPNPATIPYGTPLSSAQLNAAQTGSIPGAFSYSSPLGTVLPVGTNTITATFTPTDTVNYTTVTKTATVTVTQFTPVITWAASTISFGTALSATQLNAVANDINGTAIPGTYSYSPAAGTILPIGANQDTVTFTPTNTTNFATATATRTITVIRTATVTTLSINPATIAVGQSSTITATVTPTSGAGPVTGQVSFTDGLGTISPAQVTLTNGVATFSYTPTAVGTHVITVSFPNTTNYSASSAGGNLVVGQGVPVINFTPNPATIPYGTPLSAAQLNAIETTGTILGAFSYSSPLGTVLNAGANTIIATFTPTDTTSYSTVTKTATVTVTQFTPVIVWATPASIPFGTALSATQLNAVANDLNGVAVPGTYSYSPAAGTVLPLGTTQDTLTFTPTNTTNFAAVTASRAITVVAASTTTVLNINPGTITLGQATTLTATVAPTAGTATVTGTVTFTDSRGTIPSGTVALSNGVATLSYTPTANGTHTITATYSGSTNYSASSGVGTLAVGQGLPVITFAPNPATIVYGTPLSAAQLNAVQTTSIPGAFSYSSPLGTILPVGANVLTATFTPTDTANYATVTKTATVTVTQAIPIITWNPPFSTLTNIPLDSTILNATASIPGTFAYTPAAGSYLSFGTATLNLLFTPTDNTNYQTAAITRTIAVGKANPTPILFTANPVSQTAPNLPVVFTVSIPGTNITPTGIVRLFESTTLLGSGSVTQAAGHSGIATITVSTLTSGVHSIVANIAADTIYNEATSAPLAYSVGGATVPINFAPNPATIPYGTQLSAAQLNATSTVPGTFAYSPALNTILDAGVNTITATFTPTDTATYATTVKTATVTVTQFAPVIAWATPNAIPYGTPLSATQLNAIAKDINGVAVPGTYTYNPAAGTVLPVGTTQDTVTFTPTNGQNFTAATGSVPISVNPGATTTTLAINPNSISLGQSVTLTATVAPVLGTAPITGTVVFTDSRETIPSATVTLVNGVATLTYTPTLNGTHAITASFPGNTSYSPSFAVSTLAVGQGLPVITFAPNPATIPYGTPLSAAQLNAVQTTSIPGVFSYSSPLGTILNVGANTLTATFTPTDTATYATATKTATVTVTQFTPVITWATPAAIPFGTPLSATQLNAVANDINGVAIPGTYSYTPAAGTILPVGTTQDTLTFTPTNTTNFATATATRAITVNSATTTTSLTFSANPITVGQSVNLIATVSSSAGTPTGSVTFFAMFNGGSGTTAGAAILTNGVGTFSYTPPAAGSYAIVGVYNASGSYSGSSNQQTLTVNAATAPIINWNPTPTTFPYGTVLSASQLNAFEASSIAGVISYSSPLGTLFDVGPHVVTATFTPTDTVRYTTVTKTATFTVTQFAPLITWLTPAAIPNGTPLSATQLNAIARDVNGATIPGVYTYVPPVGTVLPLGITQDTVTFTPTDTLDFATATATVPINVILLPTTTTLAVSTNPIALGQSVTLTATVTPTAATGAIQFADNSGTITPSQVTLSNGIATVTYTPTTAGTHLLTASYLGATSYATSSATPAPLVVGQGAPVITFTPNPASIPYGTPLSAAQLNATSTLPGTFAYSQTLGTILDAGVYTITATFTPTDTTSYSTATKTATLTVTRFTPVITWPAIQINYGLPLTATQLNAVAKDLSGNAVPGTYTYNPALGALPPVGSTPATVNFTPTNTTNFAPATGTNTITVFRQQVALTLVPSATTISLGQPVTLTATVTASNTGVPTGTVSLFDSAVNPTQIASGPLTNGVFTFVYTAQSVGSHTLNATYSGDTNDEIGLLQVANQPVLTVNAIAPNITWNPTPTTIAVGKPITASQLNATATDPSTGTAIPGTFTYTPAAGTAPRSVGTQTLSVLFTPNDLTRYSTKTATTSLTIIPGTPVLTWATPAPINQGTPLSAGQLNAVVVPGPFDTGLTLYGGTYTYTPAAGAVLPPGVQTLSVTFTPGDAADYNSVTQTVQLTVLNAVTGALLTSSVNPSIFGQPVVLTTTITQAGTLTTPVTGAVTFYEGETPLGKAVPVIANANGATASLTLTNLATGTHRLTALYSGDANYLTGTTPALTQTVTIAPVILNWTPTAPTISYGTPLSAAQLNAAPVSPYVSPVTGLLTYGQPLGTILQAGSQALTATFTPTDTTNFLPAAGSTVIAVTQLTPTITWVAPASIMQGTPLSATQLNATATGLNNAALPGTFTYNPAAGAVLPTGVTTLRVLFTPTDLTNYTTAAATVPLTVTSADTTTALTLSSNSLALGQPVTLTARVAPVAGTGTPTGQVQFTDNSGTITPATVTLANGVASVTYTPTTAGTHLLTAAYLGTTTYNASSTLTPVPLAVGQSTPSLTWTPAPLVLSDPLGSAQLNAVARGIDGNILPGTFAYFLPNGSPAAGAFLNVGTSLLSVAFTPTDRVNYTVATLVRVIQVNPIPTTTTLTSSPNPAAFGQAITLTATVAPVPANVGTVGGLMDFYEGTTSLGTASVAGNVATLRLSNLSVGNHIITASSYGNPDFASSVSSAITQVVSTTTAAITWTPNPASIVYGTRLTTNQLNATAKDATGATLPGTFTYTPAAGALLPAGPQTLNVSFTPTDTTRYITTTATAALTVTRATPTIVWNTPAPINQGTPLSATQLNATATGIDGLTLPGTFTYNPAAGSIPTAGTQTLNVTFTPTDATDYVTNTASVALTVLNPTTGTVLTSSINPSQFGQPTVLTATIAIPTRGSIAPSGNVTFFDGPTQIGDPAAITVTSTGATATLTVATLGVGTHQLTALYANDPNYVTSTSLPVTQVITIAPVTLAWTPTVATIPYGTPLSAAQLNAVPVGPFVSNVTGLLTYTPAAGTVLSAGTQTLNAAFTPTDTADFLSAAGSTVITVTQVTPTIAWSTPAPIAQGTALSATQLNALAAGINNASLPGTYTYTPAAGTILQAGVTTLRVLFVPNDSINYTTAAATVPLTVSIPGTASTIVSSLNPSQSGQSVTFTATVVQTGTSTQPLTGTVTFYDGTTPVVTSPLTSGSATFTTSALTATTHKVRFIYNGTVDYATSTSNTISQTVTAATTRIAWTPAPASIVYGTPLSAAQLNAVASSAISTTIPGTFTYTPAAGSILTAGTQTLSVTFTPTDAVNFTAATASTTIAVTRATPTLAWTAPAAITQGTALSVTQLNATATGITPNAPLPGIFTYTPPSGTVLPSGPTTLSVLFTPTDIANYTTTTTTVPLTVSIPAARITLASLTNPSQYGQPTTLTATVTPGGTLTAVPTGNVTFSDGTRLLGTSPLNALGAATLPTTTLTAGTHTVTATYAGDNANSTVTSAPLTQTVSRAPAVLTFAPSPATFVYGTALTAAQLNATATSLYIPTVPGAFAYTPALGAILPAGPQTLSVTFTPTDTANFSPTTQTAPLTVTRATPTVTFPTPASVPVGTVLSSTQLAATATGVSNTTLPGTFTYTPAAGTAINAGPQTLSVLFTPTDTANYTTATATTTLNGTAVTLTALSSTTASLGDPAKTLTLTGTGFVSDSVARSNGVALATTYVNPTTLSAVLPTTSFRTVQTLQITVNNPTQSQTTSALPFTVSAPAVVIKVNAPATANPGDQPSITSALAAAYPVDVTGTFNLTFAPISGGVVDPAIQFSTGGNTSAFTIPAGQTTNPNLQIQTGTVAGTITVRLTLVAGGVDVTPTGLAPLVINVPTIAPTITSVTVTRSGRQLTVRTLGFSNTREVTKATFHFIPATGQQIQTPDVTVDVSSIFAGWYSQTASTAYGSTFLYTQTFTLDDDATIVGQVTVTLGNSVGASASGSSQ